MKKFFITFVCWLLLKVKPKKQKQTVPKYYIGSTISLTMIKEGLLKISYATVDDIPYDVISTIGHVNRAKFISTLLGRRFYASREAVELHKNDTFFVIGFEKDGKPYRNKDEKGITLNQIQHNKLKVVIKRYTLL
jgi:hypothetical protein